MRTYLLISLSIICNTSSNILSLALNPRAVNHLPSHQKSNKVILAEDPPTIQFTTTITDGSESDANNSSGSPNDCLPYIEKTISVKISKAPIQPVTITFDSPVGSAIQGVTSDYSIFPNSFVLQEGVLQQDIQVRIYDDEIVEGKEQSTIGYTLSNVPGGDAVRSAVNQNHTIRITDDDFIPTADGSVDVINANFNELYFPMGWKATGTGYPKSWAVMDFGADFALDPAGHPYLQIDGYQSGGQIDESVETGTFNSIGMTAINLSFLELFSVQNSAVDAQAFVDAWDGNVWQNLLTQNKQTGSSGSWNFPAIINLAIPLSYVNDAMKLRFRYSITQKYPSNHWVIDNVKIFGSYHTHIKSNVSQTPSSQYLGPNATVYFRDPTSGDLIAKIKNLTAHDYGCTSVQVDRAGTDETVWVGAKSITKKTFKVTPTNDNPNGNYEITLYYKASELANFNGADIKSMGKSEGGIQQATLGNSVTAAVQMAMFNNDYAYTATFNSGFSGFGLSDAPAGGALPVTLSRFEGKHSSEGNLLVWETSSEVNSDYFILERSVDAEKFAEIGKVDGVGNSAIRNSYSFTDNHFVSGLNYYRLKQVDKDGSFAYSRMIAIDSPGSDGLKYFPNPVQSTLTMEIPESLAKVTVSVVNAAGQVVMKKEKVKSQQGKVSVDLSKLAPGVYQVVVSTEKGSYHSSVVKAP